MRGVRNAPRTLDLDLLLFGALRACRDAELGCRIRARTCAPSCCWPLAELEPGLELPGVGSLDPWLVKAADQAIERIDAA